MPQSKDAWLLNAVAPGMRLVYEGTPFRTMNAGLGHRVEFCPAVGSLGTPEGGRPLASLCLRHRDASGREVGRAPLGRDEAVAWASLLRLMGNDRPHERERSLGFGVAHSELVTRHGIAWRSERTPITGDYFTIAVATRQPALLPVSHVAELLAILDEFESLCRHVFGEG